MSTSDEMGPLIFRQKMGKTRSGSEERDAKMFFAARVGIFHL